jgi:23S rRNA pseudouridine2604 synthase
MSGIANCKLLIANSPISGQVHSWYLAGEDKMLMPAQFPDDSISLNKYIADTGFCSRREADKYIEQGRVTINGKTAKAGNRVKAGATVELDGESIGKKKATMYIAYHKPVGVTSTTDTKDKTNIIDAIGHRERIFPVGRLDKDSEGLIFLTNDGNIVNKILRAGNQHDKEYVVRVDKPVTAEFIQAMSSGVRILDTTTQPCKVVQEGKQGFRITLRQGLNRQIRRMCTALGYEVERLKRVRIMNVHLSTLPVGNWRYLTPEETKGLMQMVASSREDASASVGSALVADRKSKSGPASAKPTAGAVKSEERKVKSASPAVSRSAKAGKVQSGELKMERGGGNTKSGRPIAKSEERRTEKEVRSVKSGERISKSGAPKTKEGAKAEASKKAAVPKKSSYKDFKKGARKRS